MLCPLGLPEWASVATGTHFAYCILRPCLQNETKPDELSQETEIVHITSFVTWILPCLTLPIRDTKAPLNFPVTKVTDVPFSFSIILVRLLSLLTRCSDPKSPNSSPSPESPLTQKEDLPLSVNANIMVLSFSLIYSFPHIFNVTKSYHSILLHPFLFSLPTKVSPLQFWSFIFLP